MSDTKNARDLVYEVAAILGKYVPGEALGSVEYDVIDGCIDSVLGEVRPIVYIGDRDEIPLEYFQTIARLVAVHAAAKFNNAPVDLAMVVQHEARLRYLTSQRPSYQVMQGEYF